MMSGQASLRPQVEDKAHVENRGWRQIGDLTVPLATDWAERAELNRVQMLADKLESPPNNTRFGSQTAIFHDAENAEYSVVQTPKDDPAGLERFDLTVTISAFSGSFLSLAVDLPQVGATGLTRRHIVSCQLEVHAPNGIDVFARLNVRDGRNTEQLTEPVTIGSRQTIDFDLFHSNLDDAAVAAAWIDVIFSNPSGGTIVVEDFTFSRRHRARF